MDSKQTNHNNWPYRHEPQNIVIHVVEFVFAFFFVGKSPERKPQQNNNLFTFF